QLQRGHHADPPRRRLRRGRKARLCPPRLGAGTAPVRGAGSPRYRSAPAQANRQPERCRGLVIHPARAPFESSTAAMSVRSERRSRRLTSEVFEVACAAAIPVFIAEVAVEGMGLRATA